MTILDDQTLLIPYGTREWSNRRLKIENNRTFKCVAPHVIINLSNPQPLRINTGQYEFMEPPNHQELGEPSAQLNFILNHKKIQCDLWGKFQKLFLDRYFQFIAAHVEENYLLLQELISPFGRLYQPKDWIFSALRPLPQVYFCVSQKYGSYAPEDLIAADFGFWGPKGGIALYLVNSPNQNAARQKRYDRLEAAGINLFEIGQENLYPDQQQAFNSLLLNDFRAFWEGEPFPSGPFKSSDLDQILTSVSRQ